MSMLIKPKALSGFVVVAALLVALGAGAQSQTTLAPAYAKPGVNLRPYQQFLLLPLGVSDTRLVPPPWVENPNPREWDLTRKNRETLASSYASAVRAGIESEGKFRVVTEPTPGTLQIEMRIVSLTPWASRAETDAQTLGSGTLTFEAHVRDAPTGELLFVFQGTQQVGQDYQENTAYNKVAGLTDHFTNWGRNISRRLAEVQGR
ncbi:MAG TPA: DUF3313 family protein [Gammaproteobacteria bacterium]